jgi:hypothetical protein
MADTDDMTDDMTDSEQMASSDFRALVSGAQMLKWVAGVAAALWLATVVFIFWTQWSGGSSGFGDDGLRFRQSLATALSASWGWAMVAVIALLGSLLLRGQLARLWLDSESDEEL